MKTVKEQYYAVPYAYIVVDLPRLFVDDFQEDEKDLILTKAIPGYVLMVTTPKQVMDFLAPKPTRNQRVMEKYFFRQATEVELGDELKIPACYLELLGEINEENPKLYVSVINDGKREVKFLLSTCEESLQRAEEWVKENFLECENLKFEHFAREVVRVGIDLSAEQLNGLDLTKYSNTVETDPYESLYIHSRTVAYGEEGDEYLEFPVRELQNVGHQLRWEAIYLKRTKQGMVYVEEFD